MPKDERTAIAQAAWKIAAQLEREGRKEEAEAVMRAVRLLAPPRALLSVGP